MLASSGPLGGPVAKGERLPIDDPIVSAGDLVLAENVALGADHQALYRKIAIRPSKSLLGQPNEAATARDLHDHHSEAADLRLVNHCHKLLKIDLLVAVELGTSDSEG
jgi:hypothetical protein